MALHAHTNIHAHEQHAYTSRPHLPVASTLADRRVQHRCGACSHSAHRSTRVGCHNTEACPHTEGFCTSSLHTCAWCAQRATALHQKGLGLFSRIWLSFFCQRAFHGSLLPAALDPTSHPLVRILKVPQPAHPRTDFSLILPTYCLPGQRLHQPLPTAAVYGTPSYSTPPEPSFIMLNTTEVRLP